MVYIKFNDDFYHSREKEWIDNIKKNINIIKSCPTGAILMEKISQCNRQGCNISINAVPKYRSCYNYPKITFYGGKDDICVIIPVEPYHSNVFTIAPNMLDSIDSNNICIDYLKFVSKNEDICEKVINDETFKNSFYNVKKDFCMKEYQEPYIILAHELVHALRFALDKYDKKCEEEATIFGIKNKTLYVDGYKITENQIRLELGLNMRIDHDGRIIHKF